MKVTKAEIEEAIAECVEAIKDAGELITSETEIKLGVEADGDMAVVIIARPYNAYLTILLPYRIRLLGRKHGEKYEAVILPGNYFDRCYKEQHGFVELKEHHLPKNMPKSISLIGRPYDDYMRVYIDDEARTTIIDRVVVKQWLAMQGVKFPQ